MGLMVSLLGSCSGRRRDTQGPVRGRLRPIATVPTQLDATGLCSRQGDLGVSSDIRNPAVGDIENPATSVMLMSRSKPLRL
jgi:hypothetical protein